MKKFVIFFLILVAALAYAAAVPSYANAAGLVPCGGPGEPDCNICHFVVLFKSLFDFLVLQVTLPLATVMFILGGIYFLMSGANPQWRVNAKNIIRAAVVGILIVFFSWNIVAEVILFLAGTSQPAGFPWPWNDPQCIVV